MVLVGDSVLPEVGQTASLSKAITEADVRLFADATGDTNPVHLDEAAARTTRFGKRVAHGMLTASLISAVLGTRLPGPGTIYLRQTLEFTAPVFLGDKITATVTVREVRREKSIVALDTECRNQRGELVVRGEALVLAEASERRARGAT